ncbi:MAG: hypothetical protein AAFV29_16875, partial [Myxococcota bacterium]
MILLNGEGAPVRAGPVFGRHRGAPFGTNALDLQPGEENLLLVTMTDDQLRRALPDFEADRGPQLVVELAEPPASPQLLTISERAPFKRTGLPATLQYYAAALDGRTQGFDELAPLDGPDIRVRSAVTLVVPVDPEFCGRFGQSPLRPFASSARPFDALAGTPDAFAGARDLHWLSDDELLVVTSNRLYVVKQGERWASTSTNTLAVGQSASSSRDRFQSATVIADDANRTSRIWVVGGDYGDPMDRRRVNASGAIWAFQRGFDGVFSGGMVATVPNAYLWSVEHNARGEVLAGGDNGELWLKEDADFIRQSPLPTFDRDAPLGDDWISVIASSESANADWVAGSMGLMYRFDGIWQGQMVGQSIVTAVQLVEFFGLDGIDNEDGSDVELWAGASRGRVYRSFNSGADWALTEIPYPPRFAPCASARPDGEDRLQATLNFNDVALDASFAYLAYRRCTALLMVDRRSDNTSNAAPRCALM